MPPIVIRTAADAIASLGLATDQGYSPCDIVACVDDARRPLTMFLFEGPPPADASIELALDVVVAGIARSGEGLGSIILASSRPGSEPGPTPDDEVRWARMADRCAEVGIELLDWFLFREGAVCSIAEGLDPPPAW